MLNDRYPHEVTCRKNFTVTIKLLAIKDIDAQMTFFRSLPEKDLGRLPHNVLETNYDKRIKRQIEDGRVYRLVAWHDAQIIGSLALYRGSSRWIEHTASIVVVIHPKFRRYGLAMTLLDEMIPLAKELRIEKLYANLLDEHKEAKKLFSSIGFKREAMLKDHIKDAYGRYRDVKIYSMDLEAAHKAMEDLISSFSDYSG